MVKGQERHLGSPPHMRGKDRSDHPSVRQDGITPAHAGKRRSQSSCDIREWDHPRTCGEKAWVGESKNNDTGSPPHMRGKGHRSISPCLWSRITPAHAGKSCPCVVYSVCKEDHPRTCGEKPQSGDSCSRSPGSPPHMRGKEPCQSFHLVGYRITPAHAGKRDCPLVRMDFTWDHPRTCGEKCLSCAS